MHCRQTNTHEGKRDDSLPLEHVQQLEKKHTDAGGGIIRGYWGEMLGKIFRYSQSRNSLTKYNIYIHNTFVTMVIIPPVSSFVFS